MKDVERVTQVLQGMINALMETGARRRDVIAALDKLSADIRLEDQTELPVERRRDGGAG